MKHKTYKETGAVVDIVDNGSSNLKDVKSYLWTAEYCSSRKRENLGSAGIELHFKPCKRRDMSGH